MLTVLLIAIGLFFRQSKPFPKYEGYTDSLGYTESEGYIKPKHFFIQTFKKKHEPFHFQNHHSRSFIEEVVIDLSKAEFQEETYIMIHKATIGEMKIYIPEDLGVRLQCSVLLGSVKMGKNKEEGIPSKLEWESPYYEFSPHKVNIIVNYMIGDIIIKK